jgi:hypothetical protein
LLARHVSGIADPFNGHIDAFWISHVQRSDGWIETTWNNMSDPGAFAAARAEEEQAGGGTSLLIAPRAVSGCNCLSGTSPSAAGDVAITVDFELDVQARFYSDHLAVTLETCRRRRWQQIPIVELRS